MPQTVEWLQEGKIILSKISGVLTIDEIRETSPLYVQMLDAGSAPVHIITGMQDLVLYPTNLLQLKDAMPSFNHPSMGWQIFYGVPPLARSLINVFSTITRSDAISVYWSKRWRSCTKKMLRLSCLCLNRLTPRTASTCPPA